MHADFSELKFIDEKDEEGAENRFKFFRDLDPLPEVPPALLNERDIYDYARITSMIFPFEENERRLKDKLKFASYEIDFLGEVHFSDDKGDPQKKIIESDTPFVLCKNSIAFVYLKAQFRLPYYIAVRFNLKITHVHRGLLLGTGPLVDPAYKGRLLIPLHNLTSENYTLIGGEGLIWVEFTKLSPHTLWDVNARKSARPDPKELFPQRKIALTAQKFFNKASDGTPAVSSIPGEIKKTLDVLETVKKWGAIGAGVFFISIIGLVFTTWDLISSAHKNVSDASNTVANIRTDQALLLERINTLERNLEELRRSREGVNSSNAATITKHDNR
jgi:deoxycytidine triphosphate deaminase